MSRSRRAGVAVTVVLAAGAVLLGVAAVRQVASLVGARASAGPGMALRTAGHSEPLGRSGQTPVEQYSRVFERGHFGREPKPDKPRLVGVLGAVAFLGRGSGEVKAYAVGAELPGGFVLSEIQADAVVIEREGETERLTVFPRMDDRSYRGRRGPDRPRGRPARTGPEDRPPVGEPEAPGDSEVMAGPSLPGPSGIPADVLQQMPPTVRQMFEQGMRSRGTRVFAPGAGDQ